MSHSDATFAIDVELSHIQEKFHDQKAICPGWRLSIPPTCCIGPFRKHNRQKSNHLRVRPFHKGHMSDVLYIIDLHYNS